MIETIGQHWLKVTFAQTFPTFTTTAVPGQYCTASRAVPCDRCTFQRRGRSTACCVRHLGGRRWRFSGRFLHDFKDHFSSPGLENIEYGINIFMYVVQYMLLCNQFYSSMWWIVNSMQVSLDTLYIYIYNLIQFKYCGMPPRPPEDYMEYAEVPAGNETWQWNIYHLVR